jgi:Protein of unknown function DUF262
MKSETMSVQQLFQDRRQYRVPFFQRPYVWNKEDQWERLWTDISEKAEARLDGSPSVPHFLGAAVLEPEQRSGLLGVETLNVVDGQQRFTTLQYFLAALAMILRDEKQTTLLSLTDGCLWNDNTDTMQQPDIEVFKVWPTFRDPQHQTRPLASCPASHGRGTNCNARLEAHCGRVAFELFAEAVRQPREPPRSHAECLDRSISRDPPHPATNIAAAAQRRHFHVHDTDVADARLWPFSS